MSGQRQAICHRCSAPLAADNRSSYCSTCVKAGRSGLGSPPEIPPSFWDNTQLQAALAARHMGRVVRAYRHHPFHGRQALPQGIVAGWLGVTQAQLSRIETGPPIVHLDRLIHWARTLHMPPSRLWFALPGHGQAASPSVRLSLTGPSALTVLGDGDTSPWSKRADTVEIVSRYTRGDLALDRRELGRAITGIALGTTLLEPLEAWLQADEEKPTRGRAGGLGYQELAQIEKAARLFREWDDQFGGGLRRKAVVGQLNEVADLLRDSHAEPIRRRLFGAMAQLAETTAIMSWDSGQQTLAQHYYVLALRAAKMAGDRPFTANVLAGMARQLLYLGQINDALELVRVALDRVDGHATSTVQAMLRTREAWAYAKLGRISAFRRATAKAEDTLADNRGAEDPYWISYFDIAELEGTTGGRLLELAHQDKRLAAETADRIGRAVTARCPGRLRSSALDQIGLAEARLVQGETDEAARLGHEALAVVEQTPSDRVRVKLLELYQHSARHARVPAIGGLRDHIGSVLAARVSA